MKMQVLGCAGGIGGNERLTTCLGIDQDILLDAGTGIATLDIDQLAGINHVFITHCHLDHVAGLALLVDAVQTRRKDAITVYATEKVIASLKKHLFNWVLWPDFTAIPNTHAPVMRWQPIRHGDTIEIDGRQITAFPVNHTVGSSAYWVRAKKDGFLFTGDMSSTPHLWESVAKLNALSKVIVDCSFTNADQSIADQSMHFCPRTLIDEVSNVPQSMEFLIYHLKPGQEELIMKELADDDSRAYRAVRCNDVFEFD